MPKTVSTSNRVKVTGKNRRFRCIQRLFHFTIGSNI